MAVNVRTAREQNCDVGNGGAAGKILAPLLCRRVVTGLRLPYARPRRDLYYII